MVKNNNHAHTHTHSTSHWPAARAPAAAACCTRGGDVVVARRRHERTNERTIERTNARGGGSDHIIRSTRIRVHRIESNRTRRTGTAGPIRSDPIRSNRFESNRIGSDRIGSDRASLAPSTDWDATIATLALTAKRSRSRCATPPSLDDDRRATTSDDCGCDRPTDLGRARERFELRLPEKLALRESQGGGARGMHATKGTLTNRTASPPHMPVTSSWSAATVAPWRFLPYHHYPSSSR